MLSFDVKVDMNETLQHLNEMQLRALDFHVVFEESKILLETAYSTNFFTHGSLVGGWAPRTRPTDHPLMRETDVLFGSLSSLTGPPNKIDATSATFGTDVEYARYHQASTWKMPSRKLVFEPEGFGRIVGKMALDHIMGMGRYFRS